MKVYTMYEGIGEHHPAVDKLLEGYAVDFQCNGSSCNFDVTNVRWQKHCEMWRELIERKLLHKQPEKDIHLICDMVSPDNPRLTRFYIQREFKSNRQAVELLKKE